jgi:glycosyltransferase involved in cell wall biosynthesis
MTWNGASVSVVMPAYNEEVAIASVVRGFLQQPYVDEVVVIDNNSSDNTAELARQAGARVVTETRQGYGYASQRALLEGRGDYIIIAESDSTFRPQDALKLLVYAEEFDAVFGTRTSKSCIWYGANMGFFLRYGNAAVAKLLEYLHNGPCLTDVGCTFKLLRREAVQAIATRLTVGGPAFSPELMMVLIRSGLRCVEVPVHYRPRQGTSKITGDFHKAFRLGLRMIGMIIAYRFRSFDPLPTSVPGDVLDDMAELKSRRGPATVAVSPQDPGKAS